MNCTRDFETRPPNKVWLSVEQLRVSQTCTQLNNVCFLFVNTGERVRLNNVKGHFGISVVKEVYRQNPVFTNWWKISDNRKWFDSTRRRPEDVWSHGAGSERSITGIDKKILKETEIGIPYSLFHVSKSCQKSETAAISCVRSISCFQWSNIIVQCYGYLNSSDHLLYRFTQLKAPLGLLLLLFQSQSHVTTITHNYFLRCYAFTQLQFYTFVTKITYSTFTRLHSFQTLHSNLYCTIAHKVS
jgi:hypothetical protein